MNIFMRFPEGKIKALTLSYDDNVDQDIKFIDILNSHGLKCTFNINSEGYSEEGTVYPKDNVHRRLTKAQATELYKNSGHEVAVHSCTHPFLEQLPTSVAALEILNDRVALEEQFGCIVRGMAYPYGTYSDELVEVLKNCGIVYARTVKSTEKFDIPTDWLRLPATCHHNNPKLMALAKEFAEATYKRSPRLFYLWGHTYEFESNNNWNVIEDFAEYIGNRDDIWYATNIEIYEYIEDYKRLVYSANGKLVKNPTARTLYLSTDKKTYSIAPGETVKIG